MAAGSKSSASCLIWSAARLILFFHLRLAHNFRARFPNFALVRVSYRDTVPFVSATTPSSTGSAVRKASLFYFVFVMYSYTTGGPFGLEAMVSTSGPGMTLLYLLLLPLVWCIPVSLVS